VGIKFDLLDADVARPPVYTQPYKDAVFYTWYTMGKISANSLRRAIEPNEEGHTPSVFALNEWIKSDYFVNKAKELDDTIKATVDTKVVSEKVEMLERHAVISKEMQDIAIDYLREHKDDLTAATAVRLWLEGVRIERESRGLPSLITGVVNSSDEELVQHIQDLIEKVDASGLEDTEIEQLPDLQE